MSTWRNGGSSSESSVLGTIPAQLPPGRADDLEVAARVGARVAERVVLGDDAVDDRVARVALADV
jgi:hypothetical protein